MDCYTYDFKENAVIRDDKIKSLLQKNPTINGIYDVDGASLYEVGNTIKEYKKLKNMVLIGHEICNKVEELIKDGVIDACISQNPYSQGYSAVKMVFDYIVENEKPLNHNMYTRIDIIVRENIADQRNIINPY